jgi:hypothetical protein
MTASLAQRPESRKELVVALTSLLSTLQAVTTKPGALDTKLTEYAFVPISQVLRLSRQVPVRALELCLESISILLRAGWGGSLEPALAGQLLILFTFLAKPSSADNGIAATSEELQSLTFKCMADLLIETSRTSRGKEAMTATSNIPTLGEAVLVILDTLTDSKSNMTRLQAAAALKAMIFAIPDDDALASFLPRVVSSLTKVLTPSSSNRPGFRVVEQSLDILAVLILRLISDQKTKNLPLVAAVDTPENSSKVYRSASWLQATVSQVKIALASVFKLRNHDKPEVRWMLLQLCLRIVQECRTSLSNCTEMAIETAVSLAGRGGSQDTVETELKTLVCTHQPLADILRESLHGWIVSLPRLMQSKDDYSRRQIIHQISVALRLLDQEVTLIDEKLADSLRDGISTVLADSNGLEELVVHEPENTDQAMLLGGLASTMFEPLKLRLKGQESMMVEFRLLVQELAKSNSALTVLQELTRRINMGTPEARLASFWVSVNLLKDMTQTDSIFDDFIDMGTPNLREELLDGLYTHSVMILNQQDEATNMSWHFYALALETVALQASRYKSEFRAELSEILYPVLHHLGESNGALRHHAMICLNIMSTECGYSSASELVVANVDYIVNAVGLKLAIGDVSPQAPQVLLMMMRLCGPSLLPYLDDLIGSIFDALERYHGYPKLTELLFSVLRGLTEEGVKAPVLAITPGDNCEPPHHKQNLTIAHVIETVRKLDDSARKRKEELDHHIDVSFPREPWKKDILAQSEPQDKSTAPPQHDDDIQSTEPSPPAPQTYNLLLRISELTQHYLTTSSPSLRISLLSLLNTTIPALAKHENSFLPLVNTLWPVLLPRLQDPEAYVVSNTLDILALMCEHAGDFMRSRIEDAWGTFNKVYRRTKNRSDGPIDNQLLASPSNGVGGIGVGMRNLSVHAAPAPNAYRPELYVDAPTRMIWNSLVTLLCAIASHVTINDERFDEIMKMLDPVLEREDVRRALEMCNVDAIWLWLYKKAKQQSSSNFNSPISTEGMDSAMEKMPAGRPHWRFVSV